MRVVEQYLLVFDFDLARAGAAYDDWQSYAGYDGWIARADRHWEVVFKSIYRVASADHPDQSHIYAGPPRGAFISGNLDPTPPRDDFRFVGYDAGTYYDRYGHYSLLLHHVSRYPSAWTLNKHKLFDRADDAIALVESWLAWTPENPGDKEIVDTDDEYRAFAMFAAPPLPRVSLE